jgi:parvulin-like peptidyl-prolyl isomerase
VGTAAASPEYRLPAVVARVNGVSISRDAIDSQLERNHTTVEQILFSTVLARLLDDRAKQLKITPTAAEVNTAWVQANKQSQGRLDVILQTNNLTRTQFEQQMLRPQIEMGKLQDYGVKITDADIKQTFEEKKSTWAAPPQVELYRLHTPSMIAAQAALADLRAGKAWDGVFAQYSDDQPYYKATNGLYGQVASSVLPDEVKRAIAGLKPGEYSEPMAISEEGPDHGFVIWKLSKEIKGPEPTLEAHRAEIKQMLQKQRQKTAQQVISELLRGAHIADLPAGFADMFKQFLNPQPAPTRPGPPGSPPPPPPPPAM